MAKKPAPPKSPKPTKRRAKPAPKSTRKAAVKSRKAAPKSAAKPAAKPAAKSTRGKTKAKATPKSAAKPAPRKATTKPAAISVPPVQGPIAAYTMYGGPPVRAAVRRWWAGIAARLADAGMTGVPAKPTFTLGERDQWTHPNLLLAQTCGYPMMKGVTGPVRLIATPVYDVPFADGVNYCSLVIVAKKSKAISLMDLRGMRAAITKPTSHSGYNAFRRLIADYVVQWEAEMGGDIADLAGGRRFFASVIETGNHLNSVKAVAAGRADVAAIDCVSFHFIKALAPDAMKKVRILTATPEAPGLPLITAGWRSDEEVGVLRSAVMDTLGDAGLKAALAMLRISGFQVLPREAYKLTLEMEREAQERNYPALQ